MAFKEEQLETSFCLLTACGLGAYHFRAEARDIQKKSSRSRFKYSPSVPSTTPSPQI